MADTEATSEPLHLAIVGGGVAGCEAARWAAANGARVTLFNAGLPLGGTCIHVGTFPARVLMTAATDHHRAAQARFDGIDTHSDAPDFAALQNVQRTLAARIRHRYYDELQKHPGVNIVDAPASFEDQTTLTAADNTYEPDRVLLTPGSHSTPPPIPGLDDVDTIELNDLAGLDTLPDTLTFLGCSAVSLSYAQALSRLGGSVTILTAEPGLFEPFHGPDIVGTLTDILTDEGIEVAGGVDFDSIATQNQQVYIRGQVDGQPAEWTAGKIVIVDHRRPRIDTLNLQRAGVELTDDGYIVIDESLQTTNDRVFAAGDAIGRGEHAYAAAYDATLAARNAIYPSRTAGHPTAVPYAVYTDPPLAGVGWTEPRARNSGFDTDVATTTLEQLPAGNAIAQSRGMLKLIRDRRSDHLVGAQLIAPHAAELIMELALAIRYGLTTAELSALVHPPISIGEAVARTARRFSTNGSGSTRQLPRPPARP